MEYRYELAKPGGIRLPENPHRPADGQDPINICVHVTAGKGGTAYFGLHPRKGAVLVTIGTAKPPSPSACPGHYLRPADHPGGRTEGAGTSLSLSVCNEFSKMEYCDVSSNQPPV
jgi:hypothetical protein